jgi:hypothetical protein
MGEKRRKQIAEMQRPKRFIWSIAFAVLALVITMFIFAEPLTVLLHTILPPPMGEVGSY